jgi:hypothetical protein
MDETPKNKSGWRILRRSLIGLAIFATLVGIFYTEEDWRGKRAWENCKRELEAKGAVLDWNAYIPPPVPDDQNFFKASTDIALKFVRARNDAEAEMSRKVVKFQFQLWPSETNTFPVLDTAKTGPIVVATITVMSPGSATLESASNRIILKFNDPAARSKADKWIQKIIGGMVKGAAGFKFSELQLSNLPPAQIFLQADASPTIGDLENLISADTITNIGHLHVEATGAKGLFQVLLTGVRITAAADYLKWSDQFESDFDEIREALKRPYARIDGDYSQPYSVPIPNFVMIRSLAQTMAQRAQCYLLLGQPEKALRELSLLNDSRRITEAAPTSKPMTLVAAMINVAITGLYVNTIADGLQRHAWQEPQLAALQEQLKKINLTPFVAEGFNEERAAVCFMLANNSQADYESRRLVNTSYGISIKPKLEDPEYLFLTFAPRGWVYQNMVIHATLLQATIDSYDLTNDLILVSMANVTSDKVNALSKLSAYSFLNTLFVPNFIKATQVVAHNQTLANEAQIVCALDRFRLVHGNYPDTLDALMPQFIEKLPHDIIGGQPLHYRRTDDGKFLLYSIGWNETDDGGQPSPSGENGWIDFTKGDWVWQYPAK